MAAFVFGQTRTPRRSVSTCIMLLSLLLCSTAGAKDPLADPEPLLAQHRVVYDNLLAVRLNPLGLEDRINLSYRYRMYDDPGILWRSAYVGVAFTPTLNPAVARVGGTVEIKPLAVLLLSVGYYFVGWFGSFQYLQSHDSPHAAHSDTDLDEGQEAGSNYAATGSELQLRAKVMAKVGSFAVVNDLNLYRSQLKLKDNHTLFYNARIDAMVPNWGWALTNDTDLAYITRFGLVVGLRTSIVHAFYDEDQYKAGQSKDNPNGPSVRLGPLAAYVFYDRPGSRFNKPTLLLIVNWYLKHRYRTGEDVSQGVPYVVLGFKFSGDLWQASKL